MPRLGFHLAGSTDIGQVRERNEDHLLVGMLDTGQPLDLALLGQGTTCDANRGPLAIVCDGMGGAQGGDIASQTAATFIWRELAATPAISDPQVFARLLRRAMRGANAEIFAIAKRDKLKGMGTTSVAAAVVGTTLVIANVGDSRCYVLRGNKLTQVTRDQSLASAMRNYGDGSDPALAGGTILQALGVGPDVEPSLSLVTLCANDRILLCSDGIHGQLDDDELQPLLAAGTPAAAVAKLGAAAHAVGASDNFTCVVCDVTGAALPAAASAPVAFCEFNPQAQGNDALTATSYVARRLAAKAGLHADTGPRPLPTTGRFDSSQVAREVAQRQAAIWPKVVTMVAVALVAAVVTWLAAR